VKKLKACKSPGLERKMVFLPSGKCKEASGNESAGIGFRNEKKEKIAQKNLCKQAFRPL